MKKFIFTTTGVISTVKFEELGAYFDHPISGYTLSDFFEIEEIREATTIQDSLDNNHITAIDENGNQINNLQYFGGVIPVFDIDNYTLNETYVGYGELNACKIEKVVTLVSGDYTKTWSSGNQNFDKIWANRGIYTYF